ncbi:hypothetical protein M011DRAFT_463578 [Sporormia fimetaria CBS 119925]|uniref:Uncharacterized protein n=1 Tax=Sporormia fimetaria CBS 119925 TaxID=1340428 RepID=A0A6A6VS52_9PLEO|nr:hypothetical protein M011DRAFT_463578 [Sporormia fimetaria CBS 119925]
MTCANGCVFSRPAGGQRYAFRSDVRKVKDCGNTNPDYFCRWSMHPWCRNGVYTKYSREWAGREWCVKVWNWFRRENPGMEVVEW